MDFILSFLKKNPLGPHSDFFYLKTINNLKNGKIFEF
jgi:hypothetical protein